MEVPGTGDGREGRLGMGGKRVGRWGVRRRSKEGFTGRGVIMYMTRIFDFRSNTSDAI